MRRYAPTRRHLGAESNDRLYSEADLDELQDFLSSGGSVSELDRLQEKFTFEQTSKVIDGPRYRWMAVTVDDPEETDEAVETGLFRIIGTRDVVITKDKHAKPGQEIDILDRDRFLDYASSDPEDYIEVHDELADFWKYPAPLYHATHPDNVSAIMEEGLMPMAMTRGLRNRGVDAAVFTTLDEEKALEGTYGDAVFKIDTSAMARDGYTPQVSQEPDVIEYAALSALMHLMGSEDSPSEHENDPDTVIVYGAIPPKYLRLITEA